MFCNEYSDSSGLCLKRFIYFLPINDNELQIIYFTKIATKIANNEIYTHMAKCEMAELKFEDSKGQFN